ncbi:unnamed protein product [Oppiella nova]|uniref:NF-X1-type domain-containing protein n=1 Tax=Oppiella nova TaxID=334625 RepID=A0A7R9QLQ4_9ACAR|nr:unnamed protein product [Oppiella nova]CAG2167500.1 unnamed protein product [Oppiella nova]
MKSKSRSDSSSKSRSQSRSKSKPRVNGNIFERVSDEAEDKLFRSDPILPTTHEIHYNIEPSLRRNLTRGTFKSVDRYLSTHFGLLREDLICSLRNGINEYMHSGGRVRRIKDIKIYRNVSIIQRSDSSLSSYYARLDVQELPPIDWRFSKRLIYGSLLCLSANNFKTFCFASVAGQRSAELLAKGVFELDFESEGLTDEFKHIDHNKTFVMIESEVYFEAYKHNLKALKKLTNNSFPFKEHIIDLRWQSLRPKYVTTDTMYDLRGVVKATDSTDADSYKSVKLLSKKEWPKLSATQFDDSQYEAFTAALMSRFVLIQGPPGTGKTYVGLKIVEILHQNRMAWKSSKSNKPIMIICYTNHALDQFLEGMLEFTTNIVRIGNRSKSEKLEEYTLSAIKLKNKDLCPKELNYKIALSFNKLEDIQTEIRQIDEEIHNCSMDLLNPEYLLKAPNTDTWIKEQINSLLRNYSNEFDLALIQWIANCDCDNRTELKSDYKTRNHKTRNRFELLTQMDENGVKFGGDVLEVGDQEVMRLIDSREVDEEFDVDLKKSLKESECKESNTIFSSNKKSLKRISKKVLNGLQHAMVSELLSNSVMTYGEAYLISDVTQLTYKDRWRLYRLWVQEYIKSRKLRFDYLYQRYEDEVPFLKNLCLQKNMYLIGGRDIVGMTTTGAAKYRHIMEAIDPQIVIVEEAAEVMESHVITSLTQNTEHLILIGDHKQLRPQPAVYELCKWYNLDVSLFERMINNGMPFKQLRLQHRMRPEISKLLVPNIYKHLEDHVSVKNYGDIKGIKQNMYFLMHSSLESGRDDRMSKSNEFEARLVVRLAKHLLYQDYDKSQMTILTPYSSQLILINRMLRNDPIFEGMRANIVDNFQGEENDIILLSFVRSNATNEIGFLKTSNRVNVALSRAKSGLYCVGNFSFLSKNSLLWTQLTDYTKSVNAIGDELHLCCSNHPNSGDICVKTVDDFRDKSPYGGCTESYTHDLECGHRCSRTICHISHQQLKCQINCSKVLDCGHVCPNRCHFPDECGGCAVLVTKTVPKCGHEIEELCSSNMYCYFPCDKTLECGHKCDNSCGDECQTNCTYKVEKTVPQCGHTMKFGCSESPVRTVCCQDINTLTCEDIVDIELDCGHVFKIPCNQKKYFNKSAEHCIKVCDKQLVCGHRCEGSCVGCNQSRLHVSCKQKCDRMLICGHKCEGICGDNCSPCDQLCQNRCRHTACAHTCSQPCIRCPRACHWKCSHKKCTKRCYEECDREYCPMACNKNLECGHKCIGICGEKCPDFCFTCNKPQINHLIGVANLYDSEITESKFIALENCEHIIEVNSLNHLLTTTSPQSREILKRCPKCETLITRCQAFNNVIQSQFQKLFELNRKNLCLNDENLPKQKRLNQNVTDIRIMSPNNRMIRPIITKLLNDLQNETQIRSEMYALLSVEQLSVIENKVLIMKYLFEMLAELPLKCRLMSNVQQLTEMPQFFRRMKKFLFFIGTDFGNTLQQIDDCQRELRFYVFYGKLLIVSLECEGSGDPDRRQQLTDVFDWALSTSAFTQDVEQEFKAKVEKVLGKTPELTDIEIKLVAKP